MAVIARLLGDWFSAALPETVGELSWAGGGRGSGGREGVKQVGGHLRSLDGRGSSWVGLSPPRDSWDKTLSAKIGLRSALASSFAGQRLLAGCLALISVED
jgi:hypothetical protein